MEEPCVYYNTCPILTGKIQLEEKRLNDYKSRFCNAGKDSWSKCIRFQVREIVGRCPLDIMPDASMSPEEIIEKYDL
ncbi:MAG TPA: hypothetical protein PLW88_04525 [Syntrophorhabdaceae bacterium]|nr:hypothetical protein [Syntrophorhabdaceae bacterium]HPP06613.1 hypothetical protein [Syntrophorhabdaceae bacterium]